MELSNYIDLFGGLGVFLFGMKLMSEALQQAAGTGLRSILSKMTSNKFAGVFSGFIITSIIQSSSATTVMVVGFVNAALLSLTQAIGVIMGANIGTTVTAWLVSFLGFKVKISLFALPIIAVGVLFIFLKKERLKSWGNVMIGFGLLFLGLKYLKHSIPDVAKDPDALSFLSAYANPGLLSTFLFIGIGALMTAIIQSSSATTAITITLAFSGQITYNSAIGMVLGAELGTTITANIAAIAGNINAKKAALAHTTFNVFGIVLMLFILHPVLHLIALIIPGDPTVSKEVTRFHISAFHTFFNVLNTSILIWFIPSIEKFVNFLVHKIFRAEEIKGDLKEEDFALLSAGTVKTSQLSTLEFFEYSQSIIQNALTDFNKLKLVLSKEFNNKIAQEMVEEESKMDLFRNQMLHYLMDIQKTGVKGNQAVEIIRMVDRVKATEEIGDLYLKIVRKLKNAKKNKLINIVWKDESIKKQVAVISEHVNFLKKGMKNGFPKNHDKMSRELHKKGRREYIELRKKVQKIKDSKQSDLSGILLLLDLSRYLNDLSLELRIISKSYN